MMDLGRKTTEEGAFSSRHIKSRYYQHDIPADAAHDHLAEITVVRFFHYGYSVSSFPCCMLRRKSDHMCSDHITQCGECLAYFCQLGKSYSTFFFLHLSGVTL